MDGIETSIYERTYKTVISIAHKGTVESIGKCWSLFEWRTDLGSVAMRDPLNGLLLLSSVAGVCEWK